MATLVLQAAGAAVGSLFGPFGAIAGRAIGALAGYAADQALFGDHSVREGARLADLDAQTSREGARDPARLWPRAHLRPGHLGDALRGGGVGEPRRRQGRRQRFGDTHLFILRQFRRRPLRGADRAYWPRVGGRRAVRSVELHLSALSRRRDAGDGQPDRGQAGRGAGLSRHGDDRFRASAARRFRQPHPATLLRGDAPGRRRRAGHPRGDSDPGRDRVRLRPGDCAQGGVARQQGGAQPARRWGGERLAGVAGRVAGGLPEPRARRARRRLVRRRPPRRGVHAEASGDRPHDRHDA